MATVSQTEVDLCERAADAAERLQRALESIPDLIPTDEEMERLLKATSLASNLAANLEEMETPDDEDIAQISRAAEAAGALASSLKVAEELQSDLPAGGE